MDTQQLNGKVAVVTGAASGIGKAIAHCFVAAGAKVVVADISTKRATATATELGSAATAMRCDVGEPTQVRAAVELAEEAYGGLDIMVNNAGVDRGAPLTELSEEAWQRTVAVNLGGVFAGIKYAAPAIKARGGGAILNTSSVAASRAIAGLGAYSASKAGVEALTRAAALELRPAGIRVNALVPGFIKTAGADFHEETLTDGVAMNLDAHVVAKQGRWGEPDEAARVALHLVSAESSFTSGLLYTIDHAYSVS
ncbi:NADP-dependent 3-hydroxy acid dehydrogenase YdfG [Tamaricihabitans halophyticus]|uniref:NADP-dependent 3-hydroxy acid dehydrogenase YdfG n=1 Tax=Tamaricihabitans halophyticus TaxID=1262583 RepID=A0A4R2QJD2_9PSEU|nr:SDR family oxidoreductase [Tamaricihabitans halophyticus]TCP49377.1 NADP-dependent 3-hydroxy acid dehydrogenase YdfG [Tamaricihabitans halophyticus]